LTRLFSHFVLASTLIASGAAWAATLTGTVMNGTTNKPAAGDEVVLLAWSSDGMNESARAKADGAGRFVFHADSADSRVVRAIHQGVTYHSMVPAGSTRVKVKVYDVAQRVEGVTAVMDVQRFEATGDTLEIKQLVTMRNDSKPPRTLMNDRSFEIQLPPEAQVRSGLVQLEGGPPLKQKPLAGDQKGQFYFAFPLRPGDTRFAVVYQLPYSGDALIEPQIRNPLEKFVVMLPKSMKFEPRATGIFSSMPETTPDNVQETAALQADQVVAFRISGTGTLEELEIRRRKELGDKPDPATRPGGGLGPPIEAPDPLQAHRWKILAGFAVLMLAALVHVTRKTRRFGACNDQPVTRIVPRGLVKHESSVRMNRRHRRSARV
jgi:hypothetical protein